MSPSPVTLREFRPHELLFDAEETRAILKFIFEPKAAMVNSMNIDDRVRSFAQALLLEAVDASFAMGFIEAMTSSLLNPRPSISRILRKFGEKAARHWFKYATADDLRHIRIYEIIRRDLDWSFGRLFLMHATGTAARSAPRTGWVASAPDSASNLAWC